MSCERRSISVKDVCKNFRIFEKPIDRLKSWINPTNTLYGREIVALNNISFEVSRGETVGLVGQNGSGKSTLLQLLCGTLQPTKGSVVTNGRISALLELGSGFSPDLTGYENIILNATILGLETNQIDSKINDILSFADIGEFVNYPVRTYSSSMLVRLAFAVQAQLDPDILIVDEALAVGDARFQAKCFARLSQLKDNGCCILIVSHVAEQIVTHCDRALLLHEGELVASGTPKNVVHQYLDILNESNARNARSNRQELGTIPKTSSLAYETELNLPEHTVDRYKLRRFYNPSEFRWGDGRAKILDFHVTANGVADFSSLKRGDLVELSVKIGFMEAVVAPIFGLTIRNKEGSTVYGSNTEISEFSEFREVGQKNSFTAIKMKFDCFWPR